MNWYLGVLKQYAVFEGRARRKEYWMFLLFNVVIAAALAIVGRAIGLDGMLRGLYTLGVLIPGLAVSVRRLHDTGRSGWWLLIVMQVRWLGLTSRQRIGVVAAYGATLLLAMLTHYFAGLALLGQAAYVGLRFRGKLLRWWLGGTLTAAALFCVIWLPSLLAQLDFIRHGHLYSG